MPGLESTNHSFPEFNGDLSRWNHDVDVLTETFHHSEGYEYEAQLPDVIGYLSDAELQALSAWRLPGSGTSAFFRKNPHGKFGELSTVIPEAIDVIERDSQLVSDGTAYFYDIWAKRELVHKNQYPNNSQLLHVDSIIGWPREVRIPLYLIGTFEPTVFYTGPAKLGVKQGPIYLGSEFRDSNKDGQEIQAPLNAIVRLSGASIHRAPLAQADGIRIRIRAHTKSIGQ